MAEKIKVRVISQIIDEGEGNEFWKKASEQPETPYNPTDYPKVEPTDNEDAIAAAGEQVQQKPAG